MIFFYYYEPVYCCIFGYMHLQKYLAVKKLSKTQKQTTIYKTGAKTISEATH